MQSRQGLGTGRAFDRLDGDILDLLIRLLQLLAQFSDTLGLLFDGRLPRLGGLLRYYYRDAA